MIGKFNTWREGIIWVAGLIEGEGCFLLSSKRPQRHPRFELASTDQDVVLLAQSLTSLGSVGGPYTTKFNGNIYKPKFNWYISNTNGTVALAYMVFPFLGERRQQKIKEIIAYWQSSPILGMRGKRSGTGYQV